MVDCAVECMLQKKRIPGHEIKQTTLDRVFQMIAEVRIGADMVQTVENNSCWHGSTNHMYSIR